MVWDPLKNGVLSETLGLKRPPKKNSPIEVLIMYQVLIDKDTTIGDGLIIT
jgi:hypothetical protein